MPTGFTAILQERPDLSFVNFVWRCARGMGACIMQRDDGSDVPVDMDEKSSRYHVEAIERAEKELTGLRSMTFEERTIAWRKAIENRIQSAQKAVSEARRIRRSYERMLRKVQEWTPPTPEHEGLKRFMVQQLKDSIEFDCSEEWGRRDLEKIQTCNEWGAECEAVLLRSIVRHAEEQKEEEERVAGRNKWKRLLLENVGPVVLKE